MLGAIASAASTSCIWSFSEVTEDTRQAVFLSCFIVLGCGSFLYGHFATLTTLHGQRTIRGVAELPRTDEPDEEIAAQAPLLEPHASLVSVRCSWLDGCRFWLVFCIVAGHAVSFPTTYLAGSQYWLRPALVWSATFHMPGLSLISGMCSRGPLNQARAIRILTRVLLPFIFARMIGWAFYCRLYGACGFNPFADGSVEWYLVSLLHWRAAIAILGALRAPILMTFALSLGLISGYFVYAGEPMGPQRTMAFFPFFVAGYLIDPKAARRTLNQCMWARPLAVTLLVLVLAFAFFIPGIVRHLELGGRGDFNNDYVAARVDPENPSRYMAPPSCGLEYVLAAAHRLPRYFLSFGMIAAVMVALPRLDGVNGGMPWWACAGQHTMYPYLLHPYVLNLQQVLLMRNQAWAVWSLGAFSKGGWYWLVPIALSFLFMRLATFDIVRLCFAPVIEPDWAAKYLVNDSVATRAKSTIKLGTEIPLPIKI